MNPFQVFTVSPLYGLYQAAITWAIPSWNAGNVYFYRSISGVPGSWEILNPDTPQTGLSGVFMDNTPMTDMLLPVHYRGLIDQGTAPAGWLQGPAVTALDQMTRREYCITRETLRREYTMMRVRNGLPCWHFVLKDGGPTATNVDPDTKQILGHACAGEPQTGYHQVFAGGFQPPVQTWAMMTALDPEDHKVRADATGDDPEANAKFRLLAFPKPGRGHLLVFPGNDRRYVVRDPILPYKLRGNSPLIWECEGLLLNRDDLRYTIPLPDLQPDPV